MPSDKETLAYDPSARYVQTEYLRDLSHMLKGNLPNIVQWEIQKLNTLRAHHHHAATKSPLEDVKRRSELFIKRMPDNLWASGIQIVGPRHLPRGEATALYLLLPGKGKLWIVGYFQVYTDLDGRWDLTGYVSYGGVPKLFISETIQPPVDDLTQLTGRRTGGLLGQIEQALDSYVSYSQSQSKGVGVDWGSEPETQTKPQQLRAGPPAGGGTFQDRFRNVATGTAPPKGASPTGPLFSESVEAESGPSEYNASSVKKALERILPIAPWYSRIQADATPAQREKYKLFLDDAATLYPRLLRSTTAPHEIWRFLRRRAVAVGAMQEFCSEFDKPIEVNEVEGCKLINACPQSDPMTANKAVCKKQTFRNVPTQ